MSRLAWAALVVLALALLPLAVRSSFVINSLTLMLMYALLGQAWNLLGGYAGQYSFGHAAFFGTGAFAMAILQVRFGLSPWAAAPVAVALGAAVGAFIGAVSFRYGLKGSYFALVTLAFAEVLRILATSAGITGAGFGVLVPLKPGFANLQFADRVGFFYLALACVALGLALTAWVERSRFGAYLAAIRENEDAARALGVDASRTKLAAITLSAALAALAGVFYLQYFLFIDAGLAYGPAISVEALLVAMVGGLGTLLGPLVGAAALHAVAELARHITGNAPGLHLVLYGALLILIVKFLPRGLANLRLRRA